MKISVITATWNRAKTLQYTIDSFLRQVEACRNVGVELEHVIVDGLSSDDTVQIIQRNEPRYHGALKWVSEKDRGIYDAINKGIRMSSGDVVGILNSDDFYTSGDVLLRVSQAFADDDELEAVYGDIHFVKEENLNRCTRYYSSRFFCTGLLRFGFMPAHPSFYCKRKVYDECGLYDTDLKTSSDFEMMVRLLYMKKIKAEYLGIDFVTMRAGGESTANIASKMKVNKDVAMSLRKYGIYSNQLFQWLRYAWRIGEIVYTRIKY